MWKPKRYLTDRNRLYKICKSKRHTTDQTRHHRHHRLTNSSYIMNLWSLWFRNINDSSCDSVRNIEYNVWCFQMIVEAFEFKSWRENFKYQLAAIGNDLVCNRTVTRLPCWYNTELWWNRLYTNTFDFSNNMLPQQHLWISLYEAHVNTKTYVTDVIG